MSDGKHSANEFNTYRKDIEFNFKVIYAGKMEKKSMKLRQAKFLTKIWKCHIINYLLTSTARSLR